MGEHGLSQLLLGLASDAPDRPEPAADKLPTPVCPPLSRFRTALLREDWTDAENRHRSSCVYCRQAETQTRQQTWHPSLVHLFWHARGLLDDTDIDVAYHLQTDSCRRCQRLSTLFQADRLLARLAARVRQGIADAASRLGRMLASGAVASLALPASTGLRPDQPLAFETAGHAAVLRTDPPLVRLERSGDAKTPSLLRVLLGSGKEVREQFAVPRPGKDPGVLRADLPLERLPAGPLTLALYEVDATTLGKEEVPQLCAAFAATSKLDPPSVLAWQGWASATLKLSGLETAVRSALEGLSRQDASDLPKR